MVYNIDFDIAAIYINVTLVFLAVFRKAPPILRNVIFRVMLLSNLLATIFDILSAYTISLPTIYSLSYNYFLNIMYYLFRYFSAFLYVMYGLATDEKRMHNSRIREIVAVSFIFVILSVLSTPFTKLVFYFDENLIHHYGPFYYVLYAISLISIVFVLYLKLTDKESQSSFQLLTSVAYTVLLFGAFVFRLVSDKTLVELFAVALGCFVMYVSLDNPEKYLYKTISVYNRNAFDDYIYHKAQKNKEFQVLIFTPKEAENYKALLPTNKLFAIEKVLIKAIKRIQSDYFFILSDFCYAFICNDYKNEMAKINKLLEKNIKVGEEEYALEMSYAIIRYPEVAKNYNELYLVLDDLLYRINNQISNEPLEVDPNVLLVKEKKKNEKILIDAIKNNKVYVEYEPIFDINGADALNAEAKIMIDDNGKSIAMNEEMYKVADIDGLIADINEIALKQIAAFIKNSNIQKFGINNIIVNLSLAELMNINFIDKLQEMMGEYKLPSNHICFKLLDFDLNTNVDVIVNNMNEVQKLGFKFVIDNFGENAINVSSLDSLPIVGVKLGETMIKEAISNKKKKTVLVGLVNILKELNYSIAISGVSNISEDNLARAMKINYVQGSFYGTQMPGDEFIDFYKTQFIDILASINRN